MKFYISSNLLLLRKQQGSYTSPSIFNIYLESNNLFFQKNILIFLKVVYNNKNGVIQSERDSREFIKYRRD